MSDGHEVTNQQLAPLAAWLAAAHARPKDCALFLDVDGTLAPVVERADDARVPTDVSRILGHLSARLGMVACVSGRAAADAKRLVGVGGIVYAGAHGAELLDPATGQVERAPELEAWQKPVRDFVATIDHAEMRRVGVRLEDKDFIQALHWRGAELEEEAEALVRNAEAGARELGFEIHHGRKVLEIRPPIHFNKGIVVTLLVKQSGLQYAAYVGDDNTYVDAFEALLELHEHGDIEVALCVGVASEEAPAQLVARADTMVEGPAGVNRLLQEI